MMKGRQSNLQITEHTDGFSARTIFLQRQLLWFSRFLWSASLWTKQRSACISQSIKPLKRKPYRNQLVAAIGGLNLFILKELFYCTPNKQ